MIGSLPFERAEAFFPVQGLADDLIKIIMLRRPAKCPPDFDRGGDDGGRITRTAFCYTYIKADTGNAFDGLDDF